MFALPDEITANHQYFSLSSNEYSYEQLRDSWNYLIGVIKSYSENKIGIQMQSAVSIQHSDSRNGICEQHYSTELHVERDQMNNKSNPSEMLVSGWVEKTETRELSTNNSKGRRN